MKRTIDIDHIRNIGIMAHIDAGKTTTTERMLYYTGITHRIGEVDKGTAVMDWMDQEKERGITITSAATTCFWKKHQINIIDTPGHVDFTIEVERALKVLDGAIAILCAVGGVEPQSETIWRQANTYKIPRIVYVNKMDRAGADMEQAIHMIQEKLSAPAYPINIPVGKEDNFCGVIDLIEMVMFSYQDDTLGADFDTLPIPAEMRGKAEQAREILLEKLSENDDAILEALVAEKELSPDTIRSSIRKAVLNHQLVPVLCGASLRNKGVQNLLDAIIYYLPSPSDLPPIEGYHPVTKQPISRELNDDNYFSGLVFKIYSDPFLDKLVYLRVYSGSLSVKSQVLNPRTERKERISKIYQMHSSTRKEIDEVLSGNIVGLAGIKDIRTGDTLCDIKHPIAFEPMKFPPQVIFAAVEPKSKADESKLNETLEKLQIEDPTFSVKYDSETGQTIIAGMGELHLEVLMERAKREFNTQVNMGQPQVGYRESISKASIGESQFNQLVGDSVQYAEVKLEVKPRQRGKGYKVVSALEPSRLVTDNILKIIEKSIIAASESGTIAGYPLTDIKTVLLDVKYNPDNYSELALKVAAANALRSALNDAGPILLEPVMSVEVITPEEYVGDVITELNQRGAQIGGIQIRPDGQLIKVTAPLSQMFGYSTILRSITQGRGFYMMQFAEYRRLPEYREEKFLQKIKGLVY
ncbi:elongation factor G [bacterium]|nr:elongation factor G [bacterium]